MSDTEDEKPLGDSDYTDDDDDGPSTSWGVKRRNTRPIISDSESEDDEVDGIIKDDAESCDSDSSGGAPGAETCAICLGRMRGEVGSPDACEHTFCKFCILEWARTNATCPQDRIPFTVVYVRKTLDGPVDKEVPVPKKKEDTAEVIDLTAEENPTYCEVCNSCDREERLLLCDGCDLGYHLECLDPPLSQVPVEEWFCPICASSSVPDALSNRHGASSSRPGSSRSRSRRSSHHQQEPRRIPRTYATERIRARIQKKKKKKRQRRKQNKRAKIESGEIEDKRPAIAHLTELNHYDEGDNDVEARNTEDSYAEQLLAGDIHQAARLPSQRKADAAKMLRHVAFIPQACYSGSKAKNRVMEKVNTQSETNVTDLLSGIFENQTIAFSKAKKLVLTEDRKLAKQPGMDIPCDLFQEETSFMSEPLPSQRKTPEKSDDIESSSPSEKSKSDLDKKVVMEGNRSSNKNPGHSSHHEGRHRSPFRSSYHHSSSNYKKDYSHGNCSKDNDHNKRSDGHYRRDNERYHSGYSSHGSYSSWKNRSTYEPSCSSYSNHREKKSYGGNKERDHRERSKRYESSFHQSHGSAEGNHRSRSRDRSSSKHEKLLSFSRSHKSQYKYKGESSHSSTKGGERPVRSQWSFSYFNSENSFMNKTTGNTSNHSAAASSNAQNGNKSAESGDGKISESKSSIIPTKSVFSQETAESTTSLTNSDGSSSSSVNETKSVAQLGNESKACDATYGMALHDTTHSKEHQLITVEKDNIHTGQVIHERHDKADNVMKSDVKILKPVSHKEERNHKKITIPDDSELDSYDLQGQTSHSSDNFSDNNVESKSTEKYQLKSSLGKKTKMSALFGDFEDDVREDSIKRKHNEDDGKKQKEKDNVREDSVKRKHNEDDGKNQKGRSDVRKDQVKRKHNEDDRRNQEEKDDVKEDSVKRKHNKDEWNDQKEKDEINTKCAKSVKKSKSKHLFGYDSDDDLASSDTTSHTMLEFSGSKRDASLSKKADGKNLNVNHQSDSKKDNMGCNTDNKSKPTTKNVDVCDRKNHDIKNTSTSHVSRNDSKFGIGTASHEKHGADEKQPKSHEKHDTDEKQEKQSKSHEKHDVDVKRAKQAKSDVDEKQTESHDKHDVDEKQTKQAKSYEKHDVDEKQAKRTKSHEKRDVDEKHAKRSKSHEKRDVDEKQAKQTKSHEKHDVGENCVSMKMDTKKNIVGTKHFGDYSSKNEVSQETKSTSNCNNSVKSKQVNNISENSKSKEVELGKNGKTDSKFTQNKHKAKEKRHGNNSTFGDLFGDIDDIESSSNSNLPELELKDKKECDNHLVKNIKTAEEKLHTFEQKLNKEIEIEEKNPVAECSNNSNWMLNADKVEDQNETHNKELGTFGCDSASKHKSSSGTKPDNDRIKQQKALLEVKVIEEVKKSLNPYYRNKSITKEEYKQIASKCVKKVVKAEWGDVIETEKIHSLVLGYVEFYKHRHIKSHT